MTQTAQITKENVEQIIAEAESAARLAAQKAGELIGGDRGACGFAWVEIRPARGILAKALKDTGKGDKGWNGGIHVWNPAKAPVQSIYILEQGACAYAALLRNYGINAYANSRLD
jgi:hypothetical protein